MNVLTACGIGTTSYSFCLSVLNRSPLQQYLPLAVLKQLTIDFYDFIFVGLQQYLPLAVLKQVLIHQIGSFAERVATLLTVYGV